MQNQPPEIGAWLAQNAEAVFDDEGAGEHLSDEHLAALVDNQEALSPEDIAHLGRCTECATIAAELYRSRSNIVPLRPRSTWMRRVSMLAATAAAIAGVIVLAPPSDEFRTKGTRATVHADVALLAVNSSGLRDLRDGDSLTIGDRIAFRYGNVEGRHKNLTVLAWDGIKVRWFYPEAEGGAPIAIRSGPAARNIRLPFDIKIGGNYRAGKLIVVAAFDTPPSKLAAALKAEQGGAPRAESSSNTRRFTLQLKAPVP